MLRLEAMRGRFVVGFLAVSTLAAGCRSPSPKPLVTSTASHALSLYDAFGKDESLEKDWGYSALIEHEGRVILFDTGRSADIFARNVAKLGVDLSRVDLAVLSHSHLDHTSGLDHVLKTNPRLTVYAPFDADLGAPFMKARRDAIPPSLPPELRYTTQDPPLSTGRFWKADVRFVEKSTEIFPGVTLIVTESSNMGWFERYPPHEKEPELEGLPELSLVLRKTGGDVLIVGCSHSGVERIVAASRSFLGHDIELLVGGFHLFPYPDPYVRQLALTLRDELHVQRVAPAHCTGHNGFVAFREAFGERCLYAGLGSVVPF